MRNSIKLLPFFISLFLFSNCSEDSLASDAKRLAELTCRSQKMSMEIVSKPKSMDMNFLSEANKLVTDAAILSQELKDKYKEPEAAQEFSLAYLKAFRDCQ
jgi:hypothetical protein